MRVSEEPVCINLFKKNSFFLPAFEISRSCRTASVTDFLFSMPLVFSLNLGLLQSASPSAETNFFENSDRPLSYFVQDVQKCVE
jgi:hypothetical protein